MKDWLLKRRDAVTQRAVDYGLPPAKGLLIIGIAGTGKSLSAKVTAKVFGVRCPTAHEKHNASFVAATRPATVPVAR